MKKTERGIFNICTKPVEYKDKKRGAKEIFQLKNNNCLMRNKLSGI